MAVADNKRYFWFKCDHEFFNGTKMKRLGKSKAFDLGSLTDEEKRQICALAMQAIYIRLLAESCTHDGELLYDTDHPYDDDGVSEVIDCPTSVYRATKKRLEELKLMVCGDDGQLSFPELSNFIGSETGAAIRKRAWRRDSQGTSGGQAGDNVPQQGDNTGTMSPRDKRLEIRDKNNNQGNIKSLTPLPPVGGCCDRNDDVVRQFSLNQIITACLQAHIFATRPDAEKFGKYVFDNALLESCDKRSANTIGLVKSIYNRWKSEGLDRDDLHRVTEKELEEVCERVNQDIKGEKILPADRDAFWNWMVGFDFKTTKGEVVTAFNVRKLLSWWLENKYNLKEEHEKAAQGYKEPVRDWKPMPVDPDLPPWKELC